MEQKHVLAWPRAAGSTMGPQAVPPGLCPGLRSRQQVAGRGVATRLHRGNQHPAVIPDQPRCKLKPNPARPLQLATEPGMANDSRRTRQTAGKTRITDPAP
jgi:hypothetical protein